MVTEHWTRGDLIETVGRVLDKPSVYMGGASTKSKRKAEEIINQLEFIGVLNFKGREPDDRAASV